MRSDLSDEDRQFARRLVARRFASHLSRQSLARLTQLSEATIKFVEKGRSKPTVRTIAYLLLVPELELTLEDVPPLWREQVRDVLEPDGLRPCSDGGRLSPPTPPESPPSSPSSVSPSADTTDRPASESAQPVPAVAQFPAGSSLLPSGTAPFLEAYCDRDTPPT